MSSRKGIGGKKGRSGRKSKAEEMGLKELLSECVSADDRKALFSQLKTLAADGNIEAIKLLLAYLFGKPTEKHELTGADGGAIKTESAIDLKNLSTEDLLKLKEIRGKLNGS